jgi:hypothetical protein
MLDFSSLEIPNDDLCNLSGEGMLGAGEMLSVFGDFDG